MKIHSFIKNLITKIKQTKKEYQQNVYKITSQSDFLENGVYVPNETFTGAYNIKHKKAFINDNKFIFKQAQHSVRLHNIDFSTFFAEKIVLLFFRIKINSKKKLFNGHALFLSSNNNENRLIDYKNDLMLTRFLNADRMDFVLKKRAIFSKDWKTPKIIRIDNENCFFIEEYVKKKRILPQKMFELLLNDIIFIYEKAGIKATALSYPKINNIFERKTRLNKFFHNKIYDFINNGSYKITSCHADLYRFNMIYDGHELYYIDFESLSDHIFLYDILYYVFAELRYFGNYNLFNDYLDGKYDGSLSKLFALQDLVYNPVDKKFYFFILFSEIFHGEIPQQYEELFY